MAYRRGRYWYRTRREGGRVRQEYLGTGPLAEARAKRDAAARQEREEQRRILREERERQRALDAQVDTVLERAHELTLAVLLAAGYRTHKGQWRRMRNGDDKNGDDRSPAERDE